VGDVRITGLSHLSGVGLGRQLVGTAQQIYVAIGMVGDEGCDDIFECRLALLSRR
jgi:hypothetical protein